MKQHSDLSGIVLAGVHTWGESPLDHLFPRPLLPVAGRPLCTYGLTWLATQNVPSAIICANSDTAAFRRLLGSGEAMGLSLDYYEDRMPRGPAGCLLDAGLASEAETIVVLDGALAIDIDLDLVIAAHHAKNAAVTVVATAPRDRRNGVVGVLEPTGIYVVSKSALRHVPTTAYQDIKEMWLPKLYAGGEYVIPFVVEPEECVRVSGPSSFFRLHEWVLSDERRGSWKTEEYRRIGDAHVHRSARIASGVSLKGPCVIGPQCEIKSGVSIFGPAVIGAYSTLKADAVVNRSIIWSRCRLNEGAIVDRSVIADGNIVGFASVLRNQIVSSALPAHVMDGAPEETYWALPIQQSAAIRSEVLPLGRASELDTFQPVFRPATLSRPMIPQR